MSIRSTLGLSRESSLEEGEPHEVAAKKRKALDEKLRPARLEVARRNSRWTEIENDLVERLGGRWLVSASSDRIYRRLLGPVFVPYSIEAIADRSELAFYVDPDGDLVFLEQLPRSWTEHLEKQAAKERRKAAPKPRRVPVE